MMTQPNDEHENNVSPINGANQQNASPKGAEDKSKSPRHARWTMHETFILIEGKQVAENRGRMDRRPGSVFGQYQLEPKWDSVSLFCRQHGVDRGPVQCRKRWSNLICDFRKIKTWESQVGEESQSFWMMRNDLRRERKLPGFFDREIYDVLAGKAFTATAYPLRTVREDEKDGDEVIEVLGEEEEEEGKAVFGNKGPVAKENGSFSGVAKSPRKTYPAPFPISGMAKEKQPGKSFWRGPIAQEGNKRRRPSLDDNQVTNLEKQLIKVLEEHNSVMNAQLEAQTMNNQQDREQRKDQNGSLVAALTKVADALGRIADKL